MTPGSLWTLLVQPGSLARTGVLPQSVHITNAALDDKVQDPTARTALKLVDMHAFGAMGSEGGNPEHDGQMEEVVICYLLWQKIDHVVLDIYLPKGGEVAFNVSGDNSVHLLGNFVYPDDESTSEVPENIALDTMSDGAAPSMRESSIIGLASVPTEVLASTDDPTTTINTAIPELTLKRSRSRSPHNQHKKSKTFDPIPPPDIEMQNSSALVPEINVAIRDITIGSGEIVEPKCTVAVKWIGRLESAQGNIWGRGDNFSFELGKKRVVKGWEAGMLGMAQGGHRTLTISPGLGYGRKAKASIPPNSTLFIDIELLSVKNVEL